MKLPEYKKIDVALQMLDTALEIFFEGKDYFSALHIAGACEEIFAQHLRLKGVVTSLESDAHAFIQIKKTLTGIESPLKEVKIFLNNSKNSIKHMNDGKDLFVKMDPKDDAEAMLDRAITNLWRLDVVFSPLVEKFLNDQEAKYIK